MNRICWSAVVSISQLALASQPVVQPFRSRVELVQLDVSVTRGGIPVRGLAANDFTVLDNGMEQRIEVATLDRLSLAVQFVFDMSASVSGERHSHLIAAGTQLLSALRPGDQVALLAFSNVLQVRAPMTNDFAEVGRRLAAVVPSGQTALRDALQLALAFSRPPNTRPLLIVFTDGIDNTSWLSAEDVIDSARRTGVVIDVVRAMSRENSASAFIEQLTSATGGRSWSSSDRDLEFSFTRALDDMRGRYLLAFSSSMQPGWHDLKVLLKGKRGDVVARPGYFVNR